MFEIELTESVSGSSDYKENFYPLPLCVKHIPKSFVVCLFRDIPDEAEQLLREYGKVIRFGQPYSNRPIHLFQFDYFIIDFRISEDRYYFKRYISQQMDTYFIILFRYYFETDHGMQFHNELVEFPSRQISREEYDTMLLESPLPAPHCLLSLCRYLCK